MVTPTLARYSINTDMEVPIRHQTQFIVVVMGKLQLFYEVLDMEMAHKNSNLAGQFFEDVIDVLGETSRDIVIEGLDIAEIINSQQFLNSRYFESYYDFLKKN